MTVVVSFILMFSNFLIKMLAYIWIRDPDLASLDPDPDSAKCLDPDPNSVNLDTKNYKLLEISE